LKSIIQPAKVSAVATAFGYMAQNNLKVYDAGNTHVFFKACSRNYLAINDKRVWFKIIKSMKFFEKKIASLLTKEVMMNALRLASSHFRLKQMQSASASSMPIKVCSNLIIFQLFT
jgi:hypothetical protein